MFLKKNFIRIVLGVMILFSSCSGYEKLLKRKDYNLKYNAALEFYNNKKYSKALQLFEQLIPVYRGTERSADINYYQAKCYYKQKDYYMAGYYFNNFSKSFPRDPRVMETDYLYAYCFYLTAPRPQLYQEITMQAIGAFNMYLQKYPDTDKKSEINTYLIELRDKLVEKSYLNAKLYFDLGHFKSAIVALQNAINDYPETRFREEMLFLLLKSRFLLAEGSVLEKQKERFQDTVDEYLTFISEFPESSYIKEVERMSKTANNYLNK